ncbi:MAG: helix-turn-helix domain-containing protein [Bacteroidales bacterium]|nr:helix-turn-helix domain-containing protein [Bacteroidales bacterium]
MARKSTRDMIIGVAAGLFATVGLRRTTMEIIAAAAGRGRRTIYMYFSNKAEIYDAVVDREIKLITGPLRDIVSSVKGFDAILHRYGEERSSRLNLLLMRNPLLHKDFSQGHSRVEKLRERLNREELQILTPVCRMNIVQENLPGQPSPEEYAVIFLNMLRGSDRLLTKTNGLNEAIRFSAISSDLFLRGIVSRRDNQA